MNIFSHTSSKENRKISRRFSLKRLRIHAEFMEVSLCRPQENDGQTFFIPGKARGRDKKLTDYF
jgi:hypothetical protein